LPLWSVMQTGPESRRSPRVLLRVPIEIQGLGKPVRSHTVVVNRHGALVLSPRRFEEEELVRIQNLANEEKTLCCVVWCGGEELPGLYKLGLEILGGSQRFWGAPYELAAMQLPEPAAHPIQSMQASR